VADHTDRRGQASTRDGAGELTPALLGDSAVMRQLRHEIGRVAGLKVTVLIEGAIGTGKTLVARAIHEASRRQQGPFVALDCTNLDRLTAASAFFGHRRGAFAGAAADRIGLFEAAHRGTLLLDRIGEMPLDVQGQLLRVVEEGRIRRLGETDARPLDVRLLATTSRDLAADAQAGRFREDLLYRIRIARLHVPRLESRREDIPLLADTFRRLVCLERGRQVETISREAVDHLLARAWPGNIAELKSTIEAAVLRTAGTVLDAKDFVPQSPEPR
jgi:DNA-binding NtrC family response regulator